MAIRLSDWEESPGTYVRKFATTNGELLASIKSQPDFTDPEEFGIYTNDYSTFIDKRTKLLSGSSE